VAVSGIGIVSVFGTSHDELRDGLLNGRTGIAPLAAFDVATCRSKLAASLTSFEPTTWVPPMKLRRLDRTAVYALAATKLALEDARVAIAVDGDDSIGFVLGTSTAGGQSTQVFLDALFSRGITAVPALLFDSTVGNSAASFAALEYKLRGPNITMTHKEASGLSSIVTAVDLIREGRVSGLIAGGVDAIYETVFKAHDRCKVMSPEATFSCRLAPFDAARAGFVMGEGGFLLLLEPHGSSNRGRHGDILGVGASSTVVPLNAWPDDPEPLARTMHQALEDGGLTPKDVNVVYASANATVLDATEARAIASAFDGAAPVVTSVKGALGESGASGSAACAAALLCGATGQVPPITALMEPCPEAAVLRLARKRTRAEGPIALVKFCQRRRTLQRGSSRRRVRQTAAGHAIPRNHLILLNG
jgi:3-oxoacyl-[acyl-carrier-protein] synthase II